MICDRRGRPKPKPGDCSQDCDDFCDASGLDSAAMIAMREAQSTTKQVESNLEEYNEKKDLDAEDRGFPLQSVEEEEISENTCIAQSMFVDRAKVKDTHG